VGSLGDPLMVAVNERLIFCGPWSPTFVRIDESTPCASLLPDALAVELLVEVAFDELPPQAATVTEETGDEQQGQRGTAGHGSP